jgi:hypothetical protein
VGRRSSLLAPQSAYDSAILLWIAAQPQLIGPSDASAATMPARSNEIADNAVSSLYDPLDAAFDELAVNS